MIILRTIMVLISLMTSIFLIYMYLENKIGNDDFFQKYKNKIIMISTAIMIIQFLLFINSLKLFFTILFLDIFILSAVSCLFMIAMINKHKKSTLFRVLNIIAWVSSVFLFVTVLLNVPNAGEKRTHHHFAYYKLNITRVSENDDNNFVVYGTTKAPNGSKIFCSLANKNEDGYGNNVSNNAGNGWSKENRWSKVKNGKFAFSVDPSDIHLYDSKSVNDRAKLIAIAVVNLHKPHDKFKLSGATIRKNYNTFSPVTLSLSKPMYEMIQYEKKKRPSNNNTDNSMKFDDSVNENATNMYSTTYTEDMKNEIFEKVYSEDNHGLKDVKVQGQFEVKPATMEISIYSDRFTGDPDLDYLCVVDAMKVIKKYHPDKFESIGISLWGLVDTAYSTEYRPIQSYDFLGKSFQGLKLDNLDNSMLEGISTGHEYAHFDD